MSTLGAIILAAGGSLRLGEPKQLLRHRGETLVRRVAQAALDSDCTPVCVVVGAVMTQIENAVAGLQVKIVENTQWQRGIGGSIRCGLEGCLSADPALAAVVIFVCDQPAVDAQIVNALRSRFAENPCGLTAAAYGETVGVPAIFARQYFPQLRALPDNHGAKHFLRSHSHELVTVPFPAGAQDIDTPADRRHLHLLPPLDERVNQGASRSLLPSHL